MNKECRNVIEKKKHFFVGWNESDRTAIFYQENNAPGKKWNSW